MGMTAAARQARKDAQLARQHEIQDRVLDVVLSPNMMRLAMVAGIIAYSTHVTRSPHKEGPVASALALALPGIGIPLIAADAGIHDKYALAAISAAGVGYATGQMLTGWQEAGVLPKTEWWSGILGPPGMALDLLGVI